VRLGPALCDRHFSARNAFQQRHPPLLEFVRLHVDEVGAGKPVLRNQDRLPVPPEVRKEFRGFAFERRHEFGTHEVILKWQFLRYKPAGAAAAGDRAERRRMARSISSGFLQKSALSSRASQDQSSSQ